MSGMSVKTLSPAEWESLIDDYNNGRQSGDTPLVDLCLSSLNRKDYPLQLRLHLLILLEHYSLEDDDDDDYELHHRLLLDSLRAVIQSPTDPFSFKDQFLISTTAIFIHRHDLITITSLIELLLTIFNRPNHGVDRLTRGVACECLRQLELAFPCLLSEITPHIWTLCQTERTHVSQSYVLLLSTTILNIVKFKPSSASISNATIPLIPFNVPRFLIDGVGVDFAWKDKEICYKELRRVIAFLLECPQNLTPCGLVEFMVAIIPVAEELELQASLLRVQFSGLLYTFEPLLCHAFLGMSLKFLDSFQGQEVEMARRLLLLSKESQHHLVFRLLGLHWLLGLLGLVVGQDEDRKKSILDMGLSFYPTIFDSLAIKALKLDFLAYFSVSLCNHEDEIDVKGSETDKDVYGVKLFKDGLVSVSAFKWLPPWSTETAVAFRTFHKFLIGASSHSDAGASVGTLTDSSMFYTLQKMLVDSTLEFQGLVPVVIACIDRLLRCNEHCWLGENLLETLDKHLLPKLKKDYSLGFYFPVFERISENEKVSPYGLLELLMKFTLFLVEKHGPGTGLKSWRHGSKILGICRTMLIHHHSSSLFTGLSHLLASTSLYFPDLEVRDNARFYLRLLICIPGKRLRHILNTGDKLPGISPATHSSSFFNLQSRHSLHEHKRSSSIASYIHLERVIPLLVKQLWTLALPDIGTNPEKIVMFEGIRNNEPAGEERDSNPDIISESEVLNQPKEPLRVMDAKISEIVRVLRRHFLFIPDCRHMPGLKIKICCSLSFDSEPFNNIWVTNAAANEFVGLDKHPPAIYATVLQFSSSAPYGSIPSFRIPFLLGSLPKSRCSLSQDDSLAIVPVKNESDEVENLKAPICIELEPVEPMPGLVDVSIETNADSGQIIEGQLHSISIGIEDMFLRAILPDDITGDAVPNYYVDLFNALWEACGTTSSTGREAFVLKGGKGVCAIKGTQSVKLLEVPVASLVQSVERHLKPFVVCVIGESLVDMVKAGGTIKDVLWKDLNLDSSLDGTMPVTSFEGEPLYLNYFGDENEKGGQFLASRKNVGYFDILIFLPPRFHLLFQMEVHSVSTLVRIRTDHWQCLAYIDDYLETLFLG